MPTPTPHKIGKYEVQDFLGGGMSAVYRARDTLMGRTVALKILKDAYRPDDPVAQRFILEAQIAGNLNHENVVRTYDFGFDPEGRPYMVLEYLEGEDLAQAIKAGHTGDLASKARIGSQLAAALEYIHPRNVIHRDLKPANVYLAGDAVKLMDFGISRTENVSITQAGTTMGTPGYMAPEQIRGEDVTKSVDIYAFGVVMWEMFTGERAFTGDKLERIFYLVLNEPLDMVKLRARDVPEELCQQIAKCGAKEAWKRPPDLTAIRLELDRLANPDRVLQPPLSQASTMAMPVPPEPGAPKSKLWQGLLAAAMLAFVAIWLAVGTQFFSAVFTSVKSPAGPPAAALDERIDTPTGAMMLVPERAFLFGRDKSSVNLPAFYVDRTEVTNRAFGDYARATGAALPPGFDAGQPDHPVVNVTFEEAAAFAEWAGKRLPTSQQWEKAARGLDGRTFPWGEANDSNRANVNLGKPGVLLPANSYADGASPFQALQTIGNAWEWIDETATPEAEAAARFEGLLTPPPTPAERWVRVRGGSHAEPLNRDALWDSMVAPARYRSPLIGIRCVKPVAR